MDSVLDVMGAKVTLCAASSEIMRSVKTGLHAGSRSTATGSTDALAMPNMTMKEACVDRVDLALGGLGRKRPQPPY